MNAIKHKASKLGVLVLAGVFVFAGLNMSTQVTAGEVGYNFRDRTTYFYVMPSEELPTPSDIAQYCPPKWTFEIYQWTLSKDDPTSYTTSEEPIVQGDCLDDSEFIEVPVNPADKFGI